MFPTVLISTIARALTAATGSSRRGSGGVTWAELAVNFEVVVGKALPVSPAGSRRASQRAYGDSTVPLAAAPVDLFHNVKTMSNACRSRPRVLGRTMGTQTLAKILGLAGKHSFRALSVRPIMLQADVTVTRKRSRCALSRG